jgi:putative transposase
MLVHTDGELSISRQCELLGLARSSWYYEPAMETAENLLLMRLLDEQYTRTPFYGSRRLREWLRTHGHEVNRKRVQRLMQVMGIEAIYPKPRTTVADEQHEKYPYLLRGVEVVRPDHVWSTDITYLRMRQGFMYLVAIIDWYSRYVLSWQLSNTLDSTFCVEALERALSVGKPEIFNTDQGSQFTSKDFTGVLKRAKVKISMDGRGRALDNVFVERLWRTVKYEDVYLKDYETPMALVDGLGAYFPFYNRERLHQALGYQTPWQVYGGAEN